MTDTKKPKRTRLITPRGVLVFPHLNKPDTKFKPEGDYRTKLRMYEEDAKPLIDKLQPLLDAAVKKAQSDPKRKGKKLKINDFYSQRLDDNGDATGEVEFNFKMQASGARADGTKWVAKPDLFDAHGQPMPADVAIWSGTIARVAFEVGEYDKPIGIGLSLRLSAVQVIELVSSGQRDAASYGFGNEDDGEGDEEPAGEGASNTEGGGAGDEF